MQYMLLIYRNEADNVSPEDPKFGEMIAAYGKFTHDIKEAGQFIAGDALQPIATATTVRVRKGDTLTVDGPFAETKEQLGGYYLVEAKDLDEARQIAARIPTAQHGSIEIRPVMVFE